MKHPTNINHQNNFSKGNKKLTSHATACKSVLLTPPP